MARQRLRITRQGYIVLGAFIIIIIALAVILFVSCGPGRTRDVVVPPSPSPSPTADTGVPPPTVDMSTMAPPEDPPEETPEPEPDPTPDPGTPPPPPTAAAPTATPKSSAMQTPSAEMVEKAVTGKVQKYNVNMRSGPGTSFGVSASGLRDGQKLTVYAMYEEWYFVKVDSLDKYGYITSKFVKLDNAVDGSFVFTEKPEGMIEGRVNAQVIVLRSTASKEDDSNKLGNYDLGTKVFISYKEGDFYYVQIAGTNTKGYLWAQFVTPNGVVPAKPS